MRAGRLLQAKTSLHWVQQVANASKRGIDSLAFPAARQDAFAGHTPVPARPRPRGPHGTRD